MFSISGIKLILDILVVHRTNVASIGNVSKKYQYWSYIGFAMGIFAKIAEILVVE